MPSALVQRNAAPERYPYPTTTPKSFNPRGNRCHGLPAERPDVDRISRPRPEPGLRKGHVDIGADQVVEIVDADCFVVAEQPIDGPTAAGTPNDHVHVDTPEARRPDHLALLVDGDCASRARMRWVAAREGLRWNAEILNVPVPEDRWLKAGGRCVCAGDLAALVVPIGKKEVPRSATRPCLDHITPWVPLPETISVPTIMPSLLIDIATPDQAPGRSARSWNPFLRDHSAG